MAAQDAELKLKVSLDLGFFRQQLTGLGQAAAGYNLPVKVQFDRRSVQNELNALGANIRRRSYTLNVNTNLQAEIANAKTLAKELENLGRVRAAGQGGMRQQMGMGVLLPGPQSGGIGSKEVAKLYKAAAKAGILEFDKEIARTKAAMVAALDLVGRDAIAGLLNGLASQDERLKTAAASIGENLIKTIKGVLGIASPSREFRKIGEDAGKGFELGLLKAMEIAERSATRQMRRMLDRLARMALMVGGMSAAEISRQVGQARALPPVDFPATVPPRQRIAIGPSDTGRALPPGATPGALPGTAFAAQRYLPSALGEEMKRVLREAANAFLDAIRAGIRQVSVRDMGPSISRQPLLGAGRIAGFLPGRPSQASMLELNNILAGAVRTYLQAVAREIVQAPKASISRQPLLGPGSQVAGLLPAAGGTTPIGQMRFNAVKTGATLGQQQFMRAPSIPASIAGGGGIVPPLGGGRGGAGGMGSFGRALGGVNLPGAGVIRELGSEFAFATKQVLLFGQAYKMLAFIQDFPAQIGAAVSQLQNFRNTLGAISPTAEEAAASNQLILDLVDKYNVPLQSARDGFTKLYASMAPAGFSGDEIRDLFTGITQAAATFGMSADKVDRVNYAFAQMASKGQVMSEELKGQLGDVLPGAMALFAEAAGFEGPKAIQDFSQALEDGAYKGEAMVALLKNVGIVMKQEFGPGAEGAARTFQGVINRMQNSMTLLYESFEPVAINFLNGVVVPLTSGIKEISDGFNAFFTGATAQTVGGGIFAQQLQQLKPAFDGIRQNLNDLLPLFNTLGQVLSSLGKAFIQLAGNPFVGYLLRTYAAVLPLVSIIKILNLQAIIPMIASIIRAIPAFIAFNAAKLRLITTNKSLQLAMQLTGTTAAVTAGRIRLVGAALASLVAPAVLLGIGALIERFMMLKGAVDGVRQSTQQMVASISSMANTGAVKDLRNIYMTTQQQIRTFERLRPFVEGGAIGPAKKLTPSAAAKMEEVGLGSFVSKDILGKPYVSDFVNASKIIEERLKGLRKQADAVREKFPLAQRVAVDLAKQAQNAQQIAPIPATAAEEKSAAKEKAKKERESQVPLLELELATTQQMFELEKQIMAARLGENELEVVRLNGLKEQLRFNEQIAKVKLDNELPAAEKALQIQRLTKEAELARLQTNFDLETKILEAYKKINDTIVDIGKQSALELEDRKEYQRLVMDGILPSTAKITVEVNRQFALEAEKLELLQAQIKDQIAILEAKQNITKEDQAQLDILRQRLKEAGANMQELPGLAGETIQSRIQTEGSADPNVSMRENIASLEEEFKRLYSWQNQAVEGSKAIGAALGEAMTTGVASLITGTATAKEVFASFLQSVGQALSQAASQMIATYIAIGIAKMFAGLGGGGGSDMSKSGITENTLAPMRQYSMEGPLTGTVGFAGYANGGIAPGGFQAFANGGVVNGPTLGLIGEGKYNEAVVPLPNGKSIPVQFSGERSARDMMSRNAQAAAQASLINLSFETTKIGNTEYVSRDQLEAAMAETRRAAINGGAARGMSMTLDRIQQSPSVRSRIGIR